MIELPYFADALTLYSRLEGFGNAVLLESGGDGDRARWDIIGSGSIPDADITLDSALSVPQTLERVHAARTAIVERLGPIDASEHREADATLPFHGGYIGHFSYELGRRLHGLAPAATAMPLAVVRYYPWAVVQDRENERSWLTGTCPDALKEHLRRALEKPADGPETCDNFQLDAPFAGPWTRDHFRTCLAQVHEYLLGGDCYQINIGQPFKAPYRGDLKPAYAALRRVARAPFSAYFPLEERRALLSVSPERFLQVRNGTVETRPIKGTRPRHVDAEQDRKAARALLASPKERAENLMIVDLLRNDLGRFCATGSVEVDQLYRLESYATVHHLTSVICGRLDAGIEPIDLLLGCLPGGSITGAPKRRAMELIDELEPEARQSWCGTIFYLSRDGQMDSSITIRSLFADGHTLTCWAGGGLVVDSEADAEFREQQHKVGALLACLETACAAGPTSCRGCS